MQKLALSLSVTAILVSACTNAGNPQVAMCQAVTKQLTGNSVSSWDNDSKEDGEQQVQIKVDFTNSSGQTGSTVCSYKKDRHGTVQTAPARVAMNNKSIDHNTLLTASKTASKELLAGTYKNTVAKSTELAGQAADKSKELAGQAKDAATQGAKALQQLQK